MSTLKRPDIINTIRAQVLSIKQEVANILPKIPRFGSNLAPFENTGGGGTYRIHEFAENNFYLFGFHFSIFDTSSAANECRIYFDPDTGGDIYFWQTSIPADARIELYLPCNPIFEAPGTGDLWLYATGAHVAFVNPQGWKD